MAVLALAFVGEAIGASIGGTILGISAAAIGGFIGSEIGGLIDNILFAQKTQGPRLTDLTVQVSTYGKAIPMPYGPENRYADNVIWSTGLIEHKKHVGGKFGFGGQDMYTYTTSVAVLLAGREIKSVKKIWANSKLIYDGGAPVQKAVFTTLAVYTGTFTQMPDPAMEANLGVGNVPAYRGSAYAVISDLQLADYGNRLPNLEFLVEADEFITVGAISSDICNRCGLDSNIISTSSLTDLVRGYVIGNSSSGTAALQPLGVAFDFDAAEVAGGLRFIKRGAAPVAVIPNDHLAGHASTENRPEPIEWSRSPETGLPKSATVTFMDPTRDYQVNSQMSQRVAGSAQNALSTDLPIVLDIDQGRRISDRMLWEAWTGRQTATASTDDRWTLVEAGQIYLFETAAGLEPLRVTRRTRGANGVINLELKRDRAEVYNSKQVGARATIPVKPLDIPGPTELLLLDLPILADSDDNSGFYFSVVGSDAWRGCDVKRALTPTSDYVEMSPMGFEATAGDVSGTVPDGTTVGFDDSTVITVTLRRTDMALSSATDADLDVGTNTCFIGDPDDTTYGEVLQFGTATMISAGVYQLTHLRRGKYGTEFATSMHGSGEIFVVLEAGALNRRDFGAPDLNLVRDYKAVSLLTLDIDAAAIPFTNTGVGLRPYSPKDLGVSGSTGSDITLSWTRRSRLQSGALGEATEAYTVRIMNLAGTVIERTASVTEPSFIYTAAMQTADFGAPIDFIRWRVAQVSATFGNGIFAEFQGGV